MRALPLLLLAPLLFGGLQAAQEKPRRDTSATPRRGDTIVAKGCLRGSMLETIEVGLSEGDGMAPAAHTFQLKGRKDLLKRLREEHDGYQVEITGVLKSSLTDTSDRGTRVGNARIVVGAESSMRGGAEQGPTQALPVLEAKSFEGSSTSCRR